MYLAFYGLRERPFNTTPDPRFLYLTPGHREALAQLIYGVQEHKGFIVLTGEVGTGKTTLLRALLQRLDGTTAVAMITNCTLPFDGLLEYMLEDFGIGKGGETHAQRLFALNVFLIERLRAGQNTVLILDEAQTLDASTLEQVRLLSNFETTTDKLLQILLVGQLELAAKLRLPELRQLKQRIGLRCRIPSLTPAETRDYIRTRLRIAGAPDVALFTDGAMGRIAEYAQGIPRLVNIVCDHSLLIGYADRKRRIDEGIVEEAVLYLEEGELPQPRAGRSVETSRTAVRRWTLGALAALLLAGIGAVAWYPDALEALPGALAGYVSTLESLGRAVRELLAR